MSKNTDALYEAVRERAEFVKRITAAKLEVVEFIKKQGWSLSDTKTILSSVLDEIQALRCK